jgi:hypothetical protein
MQLTVVSAMLGRQEQTQTLTLELVSTGMCLYIIQYPIFNSMVQHPVARVLQKFINLHRTQLQSYLFIYFILFLISTTRHVSAHL